MKIRVNSLSPAGNTLEQPLSASAINKRMSEAAENDIFFTSDPLVKVTLTQIISGAEASGTIKANFRQPCSRCMEEKERFLEVPFRLTIRRRPANVADDQDIGVLYYEGDQADLREYLEDTLILEISPFWAPELDAEKKCSLCRLKLT
jgi:uncharacterized metal-binding protein YceD (DUF177 family)